MLKYAYILFAIFLLAGCAKKVAEPAFRPLQIHWKVAQGEDESQMPRKDNCVILLTSKLMGESVIQASSVADLDYEVRIRRNEKNPEILEFEGICRDMSLMNRPECRWQASCDQDLKTVVKFHNGD